MGDSLKTLTKTEGDVLELLKGGLTRKQIQIRRGCSQQAVSKIIKSIKEKGHFNDKNKMVVKINTTSQPFKYSQPIRCHGQKFKLNILFKDKLYEKLRNKNNLIYIDGNTIKLYKNSIIIYSTQSFYAESVEKSFSESMEYFNKFFHIVENDTKTILIKPRKQNIKMFDVHFAEINNELAEECEKKGQKIRIYTTDTGKLWFTIDNSFNLHEAETQGETAKEDMEKLKPFFNDIRDNELVTMSQLKEFMYLMVKNVNKLAYNTKENAAGLGALIKLVMPRTEEEQKDSKNKKIPDYFG